MLQQLLYYDCCIKTNNKTVTKEEHPYGIFGHPMLQLYIVFLFFYVAASHSRSLLLLGILLHISYICNEWDGQASRAPNFCPPLRCG